MQSTYVFEGKIKIAIIFAEQWRGPFLRLWLLCPIGLSVLCDRQYLIPVAVLPPVGLCVPTDHVPMYVPMHSITSRLHMM